MTRLDLRPNCELCGKDLPPQSDEARMCSYECTYCAHCAEHVLHNVCPTCGGNFERRPIRPMNSIGLEGGLGLRHHPASKKQVHSPWMREDVEAHVTKLKEIPPQRR